MESIERSVAKIEINRFFLYVETVLVSVFFLILPLRNITIRHAVVLTGSILLYAIAIARLVSSKLRKVEFLCLSTVAVLVLFGLLIGRTALSFEVIYNSLNFISLFIIFITENNIAINTRSEKFIFFSSLIMSLAIVLARLSPSAFLFEDGRFNGSLVLGMTNPNLAGMMICAVYSILIINYCRNKRQYYLLLLLAVLLYMIVLTNARSCILSVIVITIYALFFSKHKIPNFIIVLIVLLPTVVVPFYLWLYRSGLSNFELLGKTFFSGREYTYSSYLRLFVYKYQILIGNLKGVHFANAHNAALSILLSLGIVGWSAVYFCFGRKLLRINHTVKTNEERVALVCILSFFIQSAAEALMFTGYFPCTVFLYIFLLIADKSEFDGKRELNREEGFVCN